MEQITPPLAPRIVSKEGNEATFVIENCFPGYGVTLGNSLQRVLLSSLPGAAIVAVKIEGADHEFMNIPGIMEDVLTILLNLKRVRFRVTAGEAIRGTLSVSGTKAAKEVTAAAFKFPSDVTVINPEAHIATLTSTKTSLKMEVVVTQGLGYLAAAENKEAMNLESGMIAIDSVFSPVQKVNYQIENMRVGEKTNYNRLSITLRTDGSLTPEEALSKAAELLVNQFVSVAMTIGGKDSEKVKSVKKTKKKAARKPKAATPKKAEEKEQDVKALSVKDLKLSSRVSNIIEENGITSVGALAEKGEEELGSISGIGEKTVKEIRRKLGRLGLILNK